MDAIVIYITVSDENEAVNISKTLVDERLAGCINIVKGIRSIYKWEGKIEDEPEVLLILKSRHHLFKRLKNRVKELHSYSVPEIIALPVIGGSDDYLRWLEDVTLAD